MKYLFSILSMALVSLASASLGAVASIPFDANAPAIISSLPPGTTAQLAGGTLVLSKSFTVPSGVTLIGAPGFATHLYFNLSAQDLYGIVLAANASNITISGLDVHSSNGIIKMEDGNGYTNIAIEKNQFQYGGGVLPGNILVYGFNCTVGCDNFLCTYNYWHDSPNSNRNYELWRLNHSHVDNNLSYAVCDGGHLLECSNTTWSNNYETHMHRMGQEIQASGQGESNIICDHDVIYDWVNPWNDSFGISAAPNHTSGVIVSNCFIKASIASGSSWGQMTAGAVGGPNRFGYLLESIAPSLVATGNIFEADNLVGSVIASGENTEVDHCTVYGSNNNSMGMYGGDGSPAGLHPSYALGAGNTQYVSTSGEPSPPANTFAGPAFYGQASSPVVPSPQPIATPTPVTQPTTMPSPVAVTQPATLTHTIQVMSDGSLVVDGVKQ